MKAVILCAGLGTRLRPVTNHIPKVMVSIGEKPLLQYHIEWLVKNGITDIGINLFYLPDAITEFAGDGSRFGAKIHYSRQQTLSENGSGFRRFKDFVGGEQCVVVYGDNFFELDLQDVIKKHNEKKGIMTITLKEWEDPTQKGIVGLDKNHQILWFKEKPKLEEVTTNVGNAGIYIVEPEIFDHIPEEGDHDFGKHIFPTLLEKNKKMFGYHLKDYHVDIGTPEALAQVRKDVAGKKRRAVFLDRDGVLNKKPATGEYVSSLAQFEWNPCVKELVKILNDRGFPVIVISNQQGLARGKIDPDFLPELEQKMQADLAQVDAHIDAFYYCPHLANTGCGCRKPAPGLFYQAAKDFDINLAGSIMIGDQPSDIEAATKVGAKTILIQTDCINDEVLTCVDGF